MEPSKRTKLISLMLVLLILIIGGTGFIVSLVNKGKDGTHSDSAVESKLEPQSESQPETKLSAATTVLPTNTGTAETQSMIVPVPEGMEAKYIKDELTSLPHIGRFSGEFVKYKGQTVLYYDQKFLDLKTGETILELPETIFTDYVWGVYVDDADQIYTISSKETPGTLYFNEYTPEGETVGKPVELKDNAVKWFTGKDGEDENFVRLWYFAVDAERIYLTTWSLDSIFQMFSRDGSLLFTQNTCYGTVLDEGNLYLAGRLGESTKASYGVGQLDLESLEWKYVTNIDKYEFGLELDVDNEILYAPTEAGVSTYAAADGEPLGEVFQRYKDGEMVTAGSHLRGFAMDQEGDFYFRSWQQEGDICLNNLYLGYDRTLKEKEKQAVTLTIYDNWRSEYVEELVLRFEARYPEEKVEYSFENEAIKGALKPAYHDKLAATLLAGDGADIVMVGGYRSVCTDVMNSDLIVDLMPYLETDFDPAAYDENLLSALKHGDEVKAFPINFYMPFLQIDVKGLRELGVTTDFETLTWSQVFSMLDVVKEKAQGKVLFAVPETDGYKGCTMEQILEELLVANQSELINHENGTVDLNQQWFVDLLKQFKSVSDDPNIAKYLPYGSAYLNAPYDYLRDESFIRINIGNDFYNDTGCQRVYEHYYPNQKPGADVRYYPIPMGEKGSNREAYSWSLYGITANSPHKESAWKFLKFAIEEENQKLESLLSLPVTKEAWSAMVPSTLQVPEVGTQQFFKELTILYRDIDTIYGADKVTMDMFYPLLQYLNDELTLEDALEKAQQSVWIRLNE